MILGVSVHDGIVNNAAVLINKDHVTSPVDRTLIDVSGGQKLGQRQSIGSDDFHLPFRSDIPQRDAFDDRPIFGRCVAVTGGHEHMVVDGERLSPGLDGGVIKRGFSDSGPDGDGW